MSCHSTSSTKRSLCSCGSGLSHWQSYQEFHWSIALQSACGQKYDCICWELVADFRPTKMLNTSLPSVKLATGSSCISLVRTSIHWSTKKWSLILPWNWKEKLLCKFRRNKSLQLAIKTHSVQRFSLVRRVRGGFAISILQEERKFLCVS